MTKKELMAKIAELEQENSAIKARLADTMAAYSKLQCLSVNPFRETGLRLIELGSKMCCPDSNVSDLAKLAHGVGLVVNFRLVKDNAP